MKTHFSILRPNNFDMNEAACGYRSYYEECFTGDPFKTTCMACKKTLLYEQTLMRIEVTEKKKDLLFLVIEYTEDQELMFVPTSQGCNDPDEAIQKDMDDRSEEVTHRRYLVIPADSIRYVEARVSESCEYPTEEKSFKELMFEI